MLSAVERMISENPDLSRVGVPQSDDAIGRAERGLGLVFPDSFKEYIRRWGAISFGHIEYNGIDGSINDVVACTQAAREEINLPENLIVVCDRDGDEYICLDASRILNGEAPVVVWDPRSGQISRLRATDFAEFIRSDMAGFLE